MLSLLVLGVMGLECKMLCELISMHTYLCSLFEQFVLILSCLVYSISDTWSLQGLPRCLVALRAGVTCPTRLPCGRAILSSRGLSLLCQCCVRACIWMWVELSSDSWGACQVDGCSHWMFCVAAEMLLKFFQSCNFFFLIVVVGVGCWAFSHNRLQPVLTGVVTGLGTCFFTVLGFPHLWKYFQYHFHSNSGLWCAAKYLAFKGLVWHSFNTSVFAICPCLLWMGSRWRWVELQCKLF